VLVAFFILPRDVNPCLSWQISQSKKNKKAVLF
jgi:hypothetical protein